MRSMSQEEAKKLAEEEGLILWVTEKNCEHKVVFQGNPFVFKTHWKEGYILCGEANCINCKSGNKAMPRFAYRVFSLKYGYFHGKILELSKAAFRKVVMAFEEYGSSGLFKILREGNGYDTKYSVTFEGKLTPKQTEEIAKIELPDPKKTYEEFFDVHHDFAGGTL